MVLLRFIDLHTRTVILNLEPLLIQGGCHGSPSSSLHAIRARCHDRCPQCLSERRSLLRYAQRRQDCLQISSPTYLPHQGSLCASHQIGGFFFILTPHDTFYTSSTLNYAIRPTNNPTGGRILQIETGGGREKIDNYKPKASCVRRLISSNPIWPRL